MITHKHSIHEASCLTPAAVTRKSVRPLYLKSAPSPKVPRIRFPALRPSYLLLTSHSSPDRCLPILPNSVNQPSRAFSQGRQRCSEAHYSKRPTCFALLSNSRTSIFYTATPRTYYYCCKESFRHHRSRQKAEMQAQQWTSDVERLGRPI